MTMLTQHLRRYSLFMLTMIILNKFCLMKYKICMEYRTVYVGASLCHPCMPDDKEWQAL